MGQLAELVLELGARVSEHATLATGDGLFMPKPRATGVEQARLLVEQAFNQLQSHVRKHGVEFPCHKKMQPLRFDAVAIIATVAYMDSFTDSTTSVRRVSSVVASLAHESERIRSELSARAVVTRLIVIGVLCYTDGEQIALSHSVRKILGEGKPELFGISRYAVELQAHNYRNAPQEKKGTATASISPELAGKMMALGSAIAQNASGADGKPKSAKLKAVMDSFDELQAYCDAHEANLLGRHGVLREGNHLRFDTIASLCLIVWCHSQTGKPVPFEHAVEVMSATQHPATNPTERFKASITELLVKQVVDFNKDGGLSVGGMMKTVRPVAKGVKQEALVHDRS